MKGQRGLIITFAIIVLLLIAFAVTRGDLGYRRVTEPVSAEKINQSLSDITFSVDRELELFHGPIWAHAKTSATGDIANYAKVVIGAYQAFLFRYTSESGPAVVDTIFLPEKFASNEFHRHVSNYGSNDVIFFSSTYYATDSTVVGYFGRADSVEIFLFGERP